MASAPVDVKQVPVSQDLDSGSSKHSIEERPPYGSYENHPFNDRVTAQYWQNIYEKAEYEGRHRFDPNYTWTAEEEKKLIRKVTSRIGRTEWKLITIIARFQNYVVGVDDVCVS